MKDEETTVVALLHDLLEDTEYSANDLRKLAESISPDTHTGKFLNQLRKEIFGQ